MPGLNPALGVEQRCVCAQSQLVKSLPLSLSPSLSPYAAEVQGKAGKLRAPNLKSETGLWDQHMRAPCNKDTDFHNTARIVPIRMLGLKNTEVERNWTPSNLLKVCQGPVAKGKEPCWLVFN